MAGDASRENGKLGGRPVGSLSESTITANQAKALAREVIRDYVKAHIPRIIQAQIENAVGVPYMVLRSPDGSYVRATDEKQLDAALAAYSGGDTNVMKVYTKEPHTAAAAMLLAYAADKPVEPVEVTGAEGGPLVVKWQE